MGWLSKLLGKANDAEPKVTMAFRAMTAEELADLDRERLLVQQVAARELGVHVTLQGGLANRDSLTQLQPLVSQRLVHADNLLLAQGLGVVLGDALCKALNGMHWCMVTDDFGTDPVVRFRTHAVQVAARDMVIKRLESGDEVDLLHLLDGVCQHLQGLIDSGDYQ